MITEAVAAAEALREGEVIEIYRWTRALALRIALRALLGMEAPGVASGRSRGRSRHRWRSTASPC